MKRAIVSIYLVMIVLLTCGCWDALSIEDMSICTAVVVDYEDSEYSFYVEIVNTTPSKSTSDESAGGQKPAVVKGSGDNFAQARVEIDKALSKPIYLGTVQSLIMTEEMADNGIEEYAFRVREMPDYRKTMDMIITPDSPMDLLKQKPENASSVGFAIEDMLQALQEQGTTFHMSLTDVLQKLNSQNKAYLLSTLGMKNGKIAFLGYSVFDGGQRKMFIPQEKSLGILYLIQIGEKATPTFLYVVNADQVDYTLKASLKHEDIAVTWDGMKASYVINLDFSAELLYQSVDTRIAENVKNAIQAGLLTQLRENVTEAIRTSLDCGCDYLSFSEPFRIKYPDVYEQLDWPTAFRNSEFTFNIDVQVKDNDAYDYIQEG